MTWLEWAVPATMILGSGFTGYVVGFRYGWGKCCRTVTRLWREESAAIHLRNHDNPTQDATS